MRLLVSSFKQSLKLAPVILKDSSFYFGWHFIVSAFIILLVFKSLFDISSSMFFLLQAELFLASVFTVFIIPYLCFKHSQKASLPKFWTFIKDNIWIMVLAHIKAFFVILLFLLLLIIPGIYKAIRFTFVTETVLFDKQAQGSILKQANFNTRPYFWKIVLFLLLYWLSSLIFGWLLQSMLVSSGFNIFIAWIYFILLFYVKCFYLLWKVHFFFEIKKEKGEQISC